MRLVNVLFFISSICYFTSSLQAQNLGVNTLTPHASAIMDITHTSRGLLIPRIPLVDVNDVTTIPSPALSLLIFNTATAGVAPNDVKLGFYYFNGTKWVGIGTGNAWELLGNTGTNAASNFIGTTDNVSLRFRTNNTEKVIIDSVGNVGVGTNAPTTKLHIEGSPSTGIIGTEEVLKLGRGLTNAVSFQQAVSFKLGRWNTPSGVYESFTRLDIALKDNLSVSNYSTDITVMSLQNNGNVGIGTIAPANKLEITHGTAGNSGLRFTNLPNTTALSTNATGDVIPTTLNPANALYWGLTGNSGTTPATNFVGTTDAQDFVTRTNNIERMRVLNSNGNVGIGTITPDYKLNIETPDISLPAGYGKALKLKAIFPAMEFEGTGGGANKSGFITYDSQITGPNPAGMKFFVDETPGTLTSNNPILTLKSNQNVGVGNMFPNNSAKLDVTSTTSGFAMPRMTSAQRKAIVAPVAGLQVYDTDLKGYYYYDGAIWDCVSVSAGTVNYFANATAPHGYLACAGQAVNRTTYAELFTAIGTLYGVGDGATTFNLPDLRGEFVRGVDNAGGTAKGVDAGRVIGSFQKGSLCTINVNESGDDEFFNVGVNTPYDLGIVGYDYVKVGLNDAFYAGSAAGYHSGAVAAADFTIAGAGYSGVSSTSATFGVSRPRNVAMLPCIKF